MPHEECKEIGDESQPFLVPGSTSHDSENPPNLPFPDNRRKRTRSFKSSLPYVLHCVLILLYTAVFLILYIWTIEGKSSRSHHLPLPSRQGLQWENRYFPTKIVDNPLSGDPREELDEAWHEMLKNDNIRVPVSYLSEQNLTSVYTKDGSEAIASLSVYHSLHCLKKIRMMMYKEHYHVNKTADAFLREKKHADHCVEYIRESLQCNPDLALVTFRWIRNTAQHPEEPDAYFPTNFDRALHHCANWEALDQWAGGRKYDLFDVEGLQRPTAEAVAI